MKQNRPPFALYSGEKFDILEKGAIIPADQISTLLSAEELLKKVKEDAISFKKEFLLELEKERHIAYQAGFEEGFTYWSEKLDQLDLHFREQIRSLENAIFDVALAATKKIVGKTLDSDPTLFKEIIANNLHAVAEHKKIIIYVNKSDYNDIYESRDELKSAIHVCESFIIKNRDDILPGGFIIETDRGVINLSSPEKLWRPIEAMFQQIVQKKKLPPIPQSAPPTIHTEDISKKSNEIKGETPPPPENKPSRKKVVDDDDDDE